MEKLMLTLAMIDAGSNGPGGWNREQLKLIGVTWPPKSGWKERAIGREITKNDYDRFLALCGVTGRQRENIDGKDCILEFFLADVRGKLLEIQKLLDRFEAQSRKTNF